MSCRVAHHDPGSPISDLHRTEPGQPLGLGIHFMSYMHMPWELFGVVRDRIADAPILAPIHVVARIDLATF
jgi:hypothetical protein